ncbi:LPS export ABC transporter periplasmic protein LptC [Zhouia sp. PK063]|uniref:LPS export ABC transporter periplasmic protein LptC n=1 Tax=Zhouia sp. PK063 TaxID=3373602 RepID=UPI00378766BD
MKILFNNIFLSIVVAFAATMLFSCENNLKSIQKDAVPEKFPSGIAENFVARYTDSGKVKAILTSKLNDDYSNQRFPYQEFPKGVKVVLFDENNNKSIITADYGIVYSQTGLINLKGNVVVKTKDSSQLRSPQLYWDQKNDWIFTDKNYTYITKDSKLEGVGIDFNKDFTLVKSQKNTGYQTIKDQEQ